jgi:hypothetical protein
MSWVKLDDRLAHHRKVRSLPPSLAKAVYGLYVASIQFCQLYETDGKIRAEDLTMLMPGAPKPTKRELEALVQADLWDEAVGGWFVHDYLEHNLSAQERAAQRKGSALRQTRHREKLQQESHALRTALVTASTPLPSRPLPSTPVPSEGGRRGAHAPMQGGSDRPEPTWRGGEPRAVGDVLQATLARIQTEIVEWPSLNPAPTGR